MVGLCCCAALDDRQVVPTNQNSPQPSCAPALLLVRHDADLHDADSERDTSASIHFGRIAVRICCLFCTRPHSVRFTFLETVFPPRPTTHPLSRAGQITLAGAIPTAGFGLKCWRRNWGLTNNYWYSTNSLYSCIIYQSVFFHHQLVLLQQQLVLLTAITAATW